MKLYGYELPGAFSNIVARFTSPPAKGSVETRPAQDAVSAPHVCFYDPNALTFKEASKPTLPGNGGYITQGIGMVEYDGQPMFNRNTDPGPVREFFRRTIDTQRLRQI